MGMGFMTWLVMFGNSVRIGTERTITVIHQSVPQESETGEERVLQGGSWYDPSNSLRQSNRFYVRYPRVSMCS